MKTSKLLIALSVTGCIGLGACGDKKKDKKPASAATIRSQPAKNVTNGRANLTFADAPNDNFYCRSITAAAVSEWSPCAAGVVSVPFGDAKEMVIEVKNQSTGEVVLQETFQHAEEIPAPVTATATAAQPIYDIRTGAIPFGGNAMFTIADGMRLVRYSNSSGFSGLDAWSLIADDPMLKEFLRVTPCEVNGGTIGLQPNMRIEQIYGQSSANAAPGLYCRYQGNSELLRWWETKQLAADQIEAASDAGQPFKYIRLSMFQNHADAQNTERMFTESCGVPAGYLGSIQDTNPRGSYPAINGVARPTGFIDGGTVPNVNVRASYLNDQFQKADVHWCLVDKVIAMQKKRFFISTFEVNRVGFQTSDKVEVHLIQEAVGQVGFESVADTVNMSLGYLRFSLPNRL
jgi:hypothetical protein